ncbi:MAG: hypothetical protein A2W91_10370 [Bacteroidetes bacterium GWF2_38_335]|nr:MAG: hypothetical protein A2W91_10370 [Bacteroidetes bacterium GWF2_38_335]OFY81891.1 MAG: hypothetical protein A2281_06670 [Bacteroidetes bacterium RIFOXYA12_FULL_38_20]HBS87969.1 hypothetical protein [Bacteroidales bacterium]
MLLMMAVIFISSCSNHGTKIELKDGELFYTSNVTEDDANKLGKWLEENYFVQNKDASVQLEKEGDVFQAKFVVRDDVNLDDENVVAYANMLLEGVKTVFPDSKVEIHLCDDKLETQKVVK